MSNFNQLKNAHVNIYGLMDEVLGELNDLDNNAVTIAKNISKLAGILKIHLGNEDRYLYPSMINSGNDKLKKKAETYQNEMGDLNQAFMTFKDNYNTRGKLLSNKATAKAEISKIFDIVSKRIEKEDHDLYPLAEKVMK